MEPYRNGWEPTEEAIRWVEENMLTTREKLLERIRQQREKARELSRTDNLRSAGYYKVLDDLFVRLLAEIDEKMVFFQRLEPCWVYSFSVSSQGGEVSLKHIDYFSLDEDRYASYTFNANYTLLSVPCHMLTVEEFAKIYGVEQVTVRQWIRRGKIRTARKTGSGWRISELTMLPGRKYVPGSYTWFEALPDLPEEFAFLREPASIMIQQDPDDASLFVLTIYRRYATPDIETREGLTAQQREKLEVLLLSHPLVKAIANGDPVWH